MNIAEILKNYPKGTKLYSPLLGEVSFERIEEQNELIKVTSITNTIYSMYHFDKDGKLHNYPNSECMLFPSKENRDWSTFKVSKKEYVFEPFEKVLVRDYDDDIWHCTFFSHYGIPNAYKYCTIAGQYLQCIPFIGNEHLLNTTNKP